jgi:hypothetical protein
MQIEVFQQSIKDNKMPGGLSVCLKAMWYDENGDWNKAHSMVDDLEDNTACWVHAYLHRKKVMRGMQITGTGKQTERDPMFLYNRNGKPLLNHY